MFVVLCEVVTKENHNTWNKETVLHRGDTMYSPPPSPPSSARPLTAADNIANKNTNKQHYTQLRKNNIKNAQKQVLHHVSINDSTR